MKNRLLLLTLLLTAPLLILGGPASVLAEQIKASDLTKKAPEKQPVSEPMQDFKGPVELLNAAKRGDTAAQLEVAILYEYGFNMRDNEVYALAWYLIAADNSTKAATHRDKLLKKLSPAQVDRARSISKSLAAGIKPAPAPPPEQAPAPSETPPAMPGEAPAETPTMEQAPPAEIVPIPENQQ